MCYQTQTYTAFEVLYLTFLFEDIFVAVQCNYIW
jgi:hypothetical protein